MPRASSIGSGPSRLRHHVERAAFGLAGIEHGQDVGMLQLRRDPDLPDEALAAQVRGQLRAEDLQGHLGVVALIVSQVDRRHPTFADGPLNTISARDNATWTVVRLIHGGGIGRE
jgi:hypothetical protein